MGRAGGERAERGPAELRATRHRDNGSAVDASPRVAGERKRLESLFGSSARFQDYDTERAPVQRYAYAGGKQVIESTTAIPGLETIATPTAKQRTWIEDGYYREYKSRKEFIDHSTGQPVDVGLIPHIARWYRLPFSGGFFVLGENHGVANYRSLLQESNQTGDVLGEGGTVPIGYYGTARTSRQPHGARAVGGATERFMESHFAKTAYALLALQSDLGNEYKKARQAKKGLAVAVTPTVPSREMAADAWLAAAEQKSAILRDERQRPYFLDVDGTTRVYLKPDVHASESDYSVRTTATKILRECITAIEVFGSGTYDELQTTLEGIRESVLAYDVSPPKARRILFNMRLPEAAAACQEKGRAELNASQIQISGESGDTLYQTQRGREQHGGALGDACSLRDVFMLEAILHASSKGYKMAGVGDNHLAHLEAPLESQGVTCIRYSEFISSFTRNAIFGK